MQALLDEWFGVLSADGLPAPERSRRWFQGGAAFDELLRERFGALHAQAAAGGLTEWEATPEGALAVILLLDQLSRNLGRGTPAMFVNDPRALALAERMVAAGDDAALPLVHRSFVYLPFMHAESLAAQDRCITLMQSLVEQAAPAARPTFELNVKFAHAHRDIVARFGRFPHRNATLGRASTEEELAFLQEPGSSF